MVRSMAYHRGRGQWLSLRRPSSIQGQIANAARKVRLDSRKVTGLTFSTDVATKGAVSGLRRVPTVNALE